MISIFNIAIVIVLIIITFLLCVFLPRPKCFFEPDICKELQILSDDTIFETIKNEIIPIATKQIVIYSNNTISPLTHTIPETYNIIRTIPNVRQVILTVLPPQTELPKCKGSGTAAFANNTLRCILPIKISAAKRSGIWVDGETKFFDDGVPLVYDNSREHAAHNKHKRLSVVLLVIDIDRPDSLPIGIATDDQSELF